ncbi:MAG TPA: hypothetical protein VJO15_00640 [Dehalococcoidia bacterium]|nr:hypothetical protein [Dehalococcoidia bacterium]
MRRVCIDGPWIPAYAGMTLGAKPRRGRAEVGAFFQELVARVEPAAMEPLSFIA